LLAALVSALVGLAILAATPVYLVGVVALVAVGIGKQYRFVQTARTVQATTTITQSLGRPRISVGDDVELELSVELSEPAPATLAISPDLPVGLGATTPTITIDPGDTEASERVSLSPHVAGAFTVKKAAVTITTDSFAETLRMGNTSELIAEPRSPRQLHVGAGGDEIAAAYGDHSAERGGSGLDPAELRKYVPGDPAARIDWKATARLGETYVREFEAQTDRATVLVSDCRGPLAAGESGHRKIDYLRDVLLAVTAVSERLDDPLGLLTVDESGIAQRVDPTRSNTQYNTIRTHLREIEPTGLLGRDDPETQTVAQTTRAASLLRGDDTAFGQTLRPYVASVRSHVERVRSEPLFDAINRTSDSEEQRLFVIATDDSNRAELREAVKLAARRGNQVLVFLTPSPLFETYALADLEGTYESYLSFEQFRKELDRAPRTRAFEVGPGDRIENVLAAGRRRRRVARE